MAVVRGDPVLFSLEEVERDRPGVVTLEQLLLLASELGPPGREVGEFGGSFARDRVPVGLVNPTKGYRAGKLAGEHTDGAGNHWWYQMQPSDWYAHQLPAAIGPRITKPQERSQGVVLLRLSTRPLWGRVFLSRTSQPS